MVGAAVASSIAFPSSSRAETYCDTVVKNLAQELATENQTGDYFLNVMQRSQYGGASASELSELAEYGEQQVNILKGILSKYEKDLSTTGKCASYNGKYFPQFKREGRKIALWQSLYLMWIGSQFN